MEDVFRALADPSRRMLLDSLRSRDGQSLGELCEVLPNMTRYGVSSHLDVLEAAGLISSRRDGRLKLHYLNAVPLREIQRRWLSNFGAATADRLLGLKASVEHKENAMNHRHVYTVYIDAPRQAVWDELTATGRPLEWLYGSITEATWEKGTRYSYSTPSGDVLIDGEVVEVREPECLAITFDCHWDPEVEAEAPGLTEYELTEEGGQTKFVVIQPKNGPVTTAQSVEATPWIYSKFKSVIEARNASLA